MNIIEHLRKKNCLHFSAKFHISLQNSVKNLQNPAFPEKLFKMLLLSSVYSAVMQNLVILCWYKKCLQ